MLSLDNLFALLIGIFRLGDTLIRLSLGCSDWDIKTMEIPSLDYLFAVLIAILRLRTTEILPLDFLFAVLGIGILRLWRYSH